MLFIKAYATNPIVSFLNVFSGGGFASIGIFALGIVPYINASIVMQLATTSIPSLRKAYRKKKEKQEDKKYHSLLAILLCFGQLVQGIGVSLWVRPYVFNWDATFVCK